MFAVAGQTNNLDTSCTLRHCQVWVILDLTVVLLGLSEIWCLAAQAVGRWWCWAGAMGEKSSLRE